VPIEEAAQAHPAWISRSVPERYRQQYDHHQLWLRGHVIRRGSPCRWLLVSDVPPRGRPCDHDKCRGFVEGCSCAVPLPHRGRRITRARRACAAPTAALAIAAREAKVGRAPCWRAGAWEPRLIGFAACARTPRIANPSSRSGIAWSGKRGTDTRS